MRNITVSKYLKGMTRPDTVCSIPDYKLITLNYKMVDSDLILGKHIKNRWSSTVKQIKEEVELSLLDMNK